MLGEIKRPLLASALRLLDLFETSEPITAFELLVRQGLGLPV